MLYFLQSAGLQAIDEIVPTLLHALEDDATSDNALDGLKQILRLVSLFMGHIAGQKKFRDSSLSLRNGNFSVRTAAVLPHILPKLVQLPLRYV